MNNKEFNQQELADFFQTTLCMVKTNFPKVKARALKNGYLIRKIGKGDNAIYQVEETEPQQVDSKFFSSKKKQYWEFDLPGEVWVPAYCNNEVEVSNLGRVRDKTDLSLRKGTIQRGYVSVSIKDKNYPVHRLVLQSFNPQSNFSELTVDHINGIKTDNRLENLRWATNEENIMFMIKHRKELNQELTRLLEKYSYEEVLNILKNIQ